MAQTVEIPSCAICLEPLIESLSVLKCGHVFHLSCITAGLKQSNKCPMCRKGGKTKTNLVYKLNVVDEKVGLQSISHSPEPNLVEAQKKKKELEENLVNEIKEVERLKGVNKTLRAENKELHSKLANKEETIMRLCSCVDNNLIITAINKDLRKQLDQTLSRLNLSLSEVDKLKARLKEIEEQQRAKESAKKILEEAEKESPEQIWLKRIKREEPFETQAKVFYETCMLYLSQQQSILKSLEEKKQEVNEKTGIIKYLKEEMKKANNNARASKMREKPEGNNENVMRSEKKHCGGDKKSETLEIVKLNKGDTVKAASNKKTIKMECKFMGKVGKLSTNSGQKKASLLY